MNNKAIGERIRVLRNNLGLSQEQVAELAGISQEAFRKFEKGKTNFINKNFESIAKTLKTDIYDLLPSYNTFMAEHSRMLEDDITSRYDVQLEELRQKNRKLEQTVRDKEQIISLMQDKIDFQQEKIQTLQNTINTRQEPENSRLLPK